MTIAVSIVEDDAGLRESICRFIQGAPGFECLGAYASAEEALANVPTRPPEVVLMDINLPKMNGIECVKRLKEKLPSLQIIMLTVYENSDRIFEALAAGAYGYLVKNTPPEKLLEAIEEIAKGGSPMSSHIARKVVQAFQPAVCAVPLIEKLAPREQQVLELLSKGRAYKQIAAEMNLSMGTIRTYIRRIYEKLHVNCRTDAVVKYLDAASSERRPISRK
ncbi:response regulator transcription factor [Pedosphaera parvula]|uniref:Two component transcriptional regulator, LuxR family n=1 Tax=Pedosphaera parvula (strain Ellin514) TaxID=320771 RepID=B9XR12_PEDPL|nr:response regulator transcription factor [Pedosphaera parvula]EEF57708.1 two component transcriptional regulator, LuxR family [Pedosphaera parvula Ellin514]